MEFKVGETIKCFDEGDIVSYTQYISRHGYDYEVKNNIITVTGRKKKKKKPVKVEVKPTPIKRNYDPTSKEPKGVRTDSGVRFTPM